MGESGTNDFLTYTSGMFYHITLGTSRGNNTIDINNTNIHETEIDADTISVTAPESVTIPDSGAAEAALTATAKTADGTDAIGLVSWAVADELADGVSIESTGNASAKLTVSSAAASGTLPIRVTIGSNSALAIRPRAVTPM